MQYAVAATTLPSRSALQRYVKAAAESDMRVLLRFVGMREGRGLNAAFRGKDYATNVLAFVYDDVEPLAGDIVLTVPVLRHEARAQGKSPGDHCAHLVVHGMLHLQGYDHDHARAARLMEKREIAILARFGIANPYSEESLE